VVAQKRSNAKPHIFITNKPPAPRRLPRPRPHATPRLCLYTWPNYAARRLHQDVPLSFISHRATRVSLQPSSSHGTRPGWAQSWDCTTPDLRQAHAILPRQTSGYTKNCVWRKVSTKLRFLHLRPPFAAPLTLIDWLAETAFFTSRIRLHSQGHCIYTTHFSTSSTSFHTTANPPP
jgi:hypothetical protein